MKHVVPERLAKLDTISLNSGSHSTFKQGHCAMEVVAWLTNEKHTDLPVCVNSTLARIIQSWNDGIRTTEQRSEVLKPLLLPTMGTAGPGTLSTSEISERIHQHQEKTVLPYLFQIMGWEEHLPTYLDNPRQKTLEQWMLEFSPNYKTPALYWMDRSSRIQKNSGLDSLNNRTGYAPKIVDQAMRHLQVMMRLIPQALAKNKISPADLEKELTRMNQQFILDLSQEMRDRIENHEASATGV